MGAACVGPRVDWDFNRFRSDLDSLRLDDEEDDDEEEEEDEDTVEPTLCGSSGVRVDEVSASRVTKM